MKQTNQTISNTPSLETLVTEAEAQLKTLYYSRRSIRRYRTVWQHFVKFVQQHQLGASYTDAVATQFLSAYRPRERDVLTGDDSWRRHCFHCMKVLADFVRSGRIERSVADMQSVVVIQSMQKPLQDFEDYCRNRRYLRTWSIHVRIREITQFMHFLVAKRQVGQLEQISPEDLSVYITSCKHYRPKTVSGIVSSIRQFLKFLMLQGILHQDLAATLPVVRVPQYDQIPSAWDPELITRLLKVVDRSSPRGRRDYAILLLACRLGLRLGDIRALTLDSINWDAATLEITQAKTQAPLCLPLTEEVGEALIDYLKSGRPVTPCREVFVAARPPFMPFSENTRLYHIVKHWKGLAGIQFRHKQRQGLHSLRHSLATQLLQQGTPIHVIADVLGHATVASTLIYAKADVEALRSAALPVEEVSDGQ